MFLTARGIAGVGAAGLSTGGLSIIAAMAPVDKRPMFTSLVLSLYAIGTVIAPVLGGVLTEKVSWRWCFYISLPCGAISVVCSVLHPKVPQTTLLQSQPPVQVASIMLTLSKGTEKRVSTSDSSEIPTLLRKACEDPEFLGTPAAIGIVHQEIVRKLNSFFTGGDSIGLQQPFHQVGLDSLVMTEMRIWIQRAFYIEVGIPEILGARLIDGLSQIVLQKLEAKCKTM
ncbi:major facilitator superfamily domain-containing protein [Aspergillus arachidicola]|uniref:Major facilitator superfamily domain-containing protein n=1 Tax=Aspergillus arachidicola TaxID=656916 RepID=A0A2G7FZU2_9EURO|nr:major facilitator superfamily domain-containing protein [Aspergillus arachidicola]PIG86116.1 hypothetical protein AARAC_008461 [Aspergillus arachidicola]